VRQMRSRCVQRSAPRQRDESQGVYTGKGANAIVAPRGQDAEGKLVAGGYDRLVSVSIPAKHPETGEAGPFVMRIFTVTPQSIPGHYKTSVQATVRREQALKWGCTPHSCRNYR
jgi:hypothetical protein